jgi:hypothetical protein
MARAISAWGLVEAKGASGDQADLGVDRFEAGVGEAVLDRGEDPGALVGDGAGELGERFEPRSPGPLDPAVEQRDRRGRWEAVDLAELLFQEVGAIEALVGLLDVGELDLLAGGEVLGVLPPEAPAASSQGRTRENVVEALRSILKLRFGAAGGPSLP